jgi:predicted F0F1-ATPase subunit
MKVQGYCVLGTMVDTEKQFTLDISGETPKVSPRKEGPKKAPKNALFYIGSAGQLGLAIIIPLLMGIAAGIYLDTKFGTKPMYTLLGLLVGLLISIVSLIKTVKDLINS